MKVADKKPILITGSHRSGSTWVGKMLALSPDVTYVHEPFSMIHRPGICRAEFPCWFFYLNEENGDEYVSAIRDCLSLRYQLFGEIPSLRGIRDALRMFRDQLSFLSGRLRHTRTLMKDPIALFSAQWLASVFDMDVVVLIRHPAAFVGSLKKANWTFSFDNFLKQPLLMEHFLSAYRHEIEAHVKRQHDIVSQGILLWNIFHSVIGRYEQEQPDWFFLKHEDIARDPLAGYSSLYDALELECSTEIRSKIAAFSNAADTQDNVPVHVIRRNSSKVVHSWKQRLTDEEINLIRSKTEGIASRYYDSSDW